MSTNEYSTSNTLRKKNLRWKWTVDSDRSFTCSKTTTVRKWKNNNKKYVVKKCHVWISGRFDRVSFCMEQSAQKILWNRWRKWNQRQYAIREVRYDGKRWCEFIEWSFFSFDYARLFTVLMSSTSFWSSSSLTEPRDACSNSRFLNVIKSTIDAYDRCACVRPRYRQSWINAFCIQFNWFELAQKQQQHDFVLLLCFFSVCFWACCCFLRSLIAIIWPLLLTMTAIIPCILRSCLILNLRWFIQRYNALWCIMYNSSSSSIVIGTYDNDRYNVREIIRGNEWGWVLTFRWRIVIAQMLQCWPVRTSSVSRSKREKTKICCCHFISFIWIISRTEHLILAWNVAEIWFINRLAWNHNFWTRIRCVVTLTTLFIIATLSSFEHFTQPIQVEFVERMNQIKIEFFVRSILKSMVRIHVKIVQPIRAQLLIW